MFVDFRVGKWVGKFGLIFYELFKKNFNILYIILLKYMKY